MEKLEDLLEEVARKVLGLPAKTQVPGAPLKKLLEELPSGREIPAPLFSSSGHPGKHSPYETTGEALETRPEPQIIQPEGGTPEQTFPDPLRNLRECEKRFQKKVHELEKLKAKLLKRQKALQEAERVKGKALENAAYWQREAEKAQERASKDAAHWQKELARVVEENERLRVGFQKAQEDWARFQKEAERAALENQRKRIEELEARVRELEGIAEQKKLLEARLGRLSDLKKILPEPFPQESLFGVLVLDYPHLGNGAEERLIALIEGYQALLQGKDHPTFRHSNRELLVGEPEGIVLVGLERLLLDLASLPLARWLRTHAFQLEAFLQREQQSVSPRLREE